MFNINPNDKRLLSFNPLSAKTSDLNELKDLKARIRSHKQVHKISYFFSRLLSKISFLAKFILNNTSFGLEKKIDRKITYISKHLKRVELLNQPFTKALIEKAQLGSPEANSFDLRRAALTLNDSRAQNIVKEGMGSLGAIHLHQDICKSYIEQNKDSQDKEPLNLLKTSLETAEELSCFFQGTVPSKKKLEYEAAFSRSLKDKMQELEEDKSLFFITGTSEHAISLQISKQKDGNFTLVVYNTGDGVAHHDISFFSQKAKPLAFQNCFIEDILDPQSIKILFDANTSANPSIFYKAVENMAQSGTKTELSYSSKLQRLGNCALRAPKLVAKEILGRTLYRKLKLYEAQYLKEKIEDFDKATSQKLLENTKELRSSFVHFPSEKEISEAEQAEQLLELFNEKIVKRESRLLSDENSP